MAQVELALMTWKQAEEARDRGAVVLIPIGTQEQNGSISPLASDTLIAEEVARRVAGETNSVVAPSINYGYSPPFRHFPGTVSVRPDTLRMLIADVCQNMVETGFRHLVMVNCHVFNEAIMEQAIFEIEGQNSASFGFFNPIYLAQAAGKELYSGMDGVLGHGSEPIASMLRSFVPEAVYPELALPESWDDYQGLPAPGLSKVKVGQGTFGVYFHTELVSQTGGSGDPRVSDPERGAEIMRRVVEQASEFVRAFAKLKP